MSDIAIKRNKIAKKRRKIFKVLEPFFYLLPVLLFFIVFTYYPLIKTVFNTFFVTNSYGVIKEFAGLDNYINILTNTEFLKSILNSIIFALVSIPMSIGIALILALISCKKTRTSSIYETMFALTIAMSTSVCAMIFQLIYNPSIGILNEVLGANIRWLTDKNFALFAIIIISTWMNIGFNYLFILAAVRGVPNELLESASLDGAGMIRQSTKIILPIISPTIFFLIVNSLARGMMMSGLVIILTGGGPVGSTQTMISFMYQQAILNQNYNDGFAAAVVAFIITFGLILVSFIYEKKGVHYS